MVNFLASFSIYLHIFSVIFSFLCNNEISFGRLNGEFQFLLRSAGSRVLCELWLATLSSWVSSYFNDASGDDLLISMLICDIDRDSLE